MAGGDGLGRGQKTVVGGLVEDLLGVLALLDGHAGVGPEEDGVVHVHLVVDLVEGHPVLDLAVVALEAHAGEALEELDQLAVAEAAVGAREVQRDLEVAERDDGLDAVLEQLVEDLVVELQALFVGLELVALGEDAGPSDGGAEALQPHLGEQLDVLAEVAVEVDSLVVRVELVGVDGLGDPAGHPVGARGEHVDHGGALAASVPAAFELVRGAGAAPQEIGGEGGGHVSLLLPRRALPVRGPLP